MGTSVAYDWQLIRQRYEGGETAYSIAKKMGKPTKQAIMKRAAKEGWTQGSRKALLATVSQLPIVRKALEVRHSDFRTPEAIATVIEMIAQGATQELAAATIGVSREALGKWKKEDAEFALLIARARAGCLTGYVGLIHESAHKGDWKAAETMLKSAPETRDQFGSSPHGSPRLEVVINISRDDTHVVDSTAEEIA